MKVKHNKKRNTAFVYEALIREATVSVLKKDHARKNTIIRIIKKHFKPSSTLKRDLDCYRSLYENQNLNRFLCEKIIKESKIQRKFIDSEKLFDQQTKLINDINKELSTSIFNNFVPNYKSLATIAQIFADNTTPKNRIILENQIAESMLRAASEKQEDYKIDNVVYKSFVGKFNNKYEDSLLEEQKELLNYYVSSFSDNALELKTFLNEEVARLKEKLAKALTKEEILKDKSMIEKTNKVIKNLDTLTESIIDEKRLLAILRTQKLVKEIYADGHSD
jgi:hypothetical protein